jgi:uncharacterized membrane protein
MPSESSRLSMGDVLALISASLIALAFVFLPWSNAGEQSFTGISLLSAAQADYEANQTTLFLVPVAAFLGSLLALWGLLDSLVRKYTRIGLVLAALTGLIYFWQAFMRPAASPVDSTIQSSFGIGYWLALVGLLGLILQVFIPRPAHLYTTEKSVQYAQYVAYVAVAAAIVVSGYLSWLKLSHEIAVCIEGSVFDCGTVLNSAYSELAGIPIAWLGLAVNLAVVVLFVLEKKVEFFETYSPVFVFGLVLFAFLFSVYLVYVQAFLIQAYCPWCLSHEALITVLFGMSIRHLLTWLNPPDEEEYLEEKLKNAEVN